MNMGLGRIAFIVAVVLFSVALLLLLLTTGNVKLIQELTLGGFIALACGHLLP